MFIPNIFNFATKELSQDAMIAWLLACLHSEDKNIKKIGANFVRFILNNDHISDNDIKIESESPHLQYYHMDVFCLIKVRDEIIPIIFEDKTETFLHSNQLSNYCEKVLWWQREKKESWIKELKKDFNCENETVEWGNTYYFLYKTGYMSSYEKLLFENEKQNAINVYEEKKQKYLKEKAKDLIIRYIGLQSMIDFLQKQDPVYLLQDYLNYLTKLKITQDSAIQNWDSSNYDEVEKALLTKAGCVSLFEEIFGNEVNIEYNYQNWCQVTIYPIVESRTDEIIDYKIKLNKYTKGYAIQLLQYRNEGKLKEKQYFEKYIEAQKVLSLSLDIIERKFPEIKEYIRNGNIVNPDKGFNENYIFMIYLKDYPINKICDFFRLFVSEFLKEISKEQ